MEHFPFIFMIILLPLIGALFLSFISERMDQSNAKTVALWCSLGTFLLSLLMLLFFDGSQGMQFKEDKSLFFLHGVVYSVGVDGLSFPFVLLTTFLVPICILMNWKNSLTETRLYMALLLFLESFLLLAFTARNLLMFYVFFEAILVPMFFLIGIWGGPGRIHATFKFFLYTAAGSILMLVGILALYALCGSFDMDVLVGKTLSLGAEKWLWWSFFLAFAVKTPMWPVHTWLPSAHVEAPTGASMLLAGVLLKLGGYGFLRFMLPLFPTASVIYGPVVFGLSAAALVLASLVAFGQKDMKRLIAYASIAHMAVVTFGVFSGTEHGLMGALFQMISHGLTSASLFLCVGILYRLYGTYDIQAYGGLFKAMPLWSFLFFVTCLSAIGFPGTSGFVGEVLVILGLMNNHAPWAGVVALGFVLSAAYVLWLCARVLFGKVKVPTGRDVDQANRFERAALAILVVGIVILGLRPMILTKMMEKPVAALVAEKGGVDG